VTTVAELRSWSPGALEDAAHTLARAMGRMADVTDDWDRAAQVLAEWWEGVAGAAARAALTLNLREATMVTAAMDLQGLVDSRGPGGPDPHITVVGHSYGSLVAGIALGDGPGPVDDAVLFGSPGLSTDTVEGLRLSPDHVYVGAAEGDVVASLGRFGRRPDSDYFGAPVFQTDGGAHPAAPGVTLPASGHSEYYGAETESLYNIASVVTGHPDQVTLVPTEGD
jgi:pimeloyl-ACP methyl ester carboxylesterase